MCRLNTKFSLSQNVPDSFTNRIVGFILGETCAQDRSARQFSTSTRITTPPSNKPSNMKRIFRNLHTLMRVYCYKNNNMGK